MNQRPSGISRSKDIAVLNFEQKLKTNILSNISI